MLLQEFQGDSCRCVSLLCRDAWGRRLLPLTLELTILCVAKNSPGPQPLARFGTSSRPFISLGLSFLICNNGLIMVPPPPQHCVRAKQDGVSALPARAQPRPRDHGPPPGSHVPQGPRHSSHTRLGSLLGFLNCSFSYGFWISPSALCFTPTFTFHLPRLFVHSFIHTFTHFFIGRHLC